MPFKSSSIVAAGVSAEVQITRGPRILSIYCGYESSTDTRGLLTVTRAGQVRLTLPIKGVGIQFTFNKWHLKGQVDIALSGESDAIGYVSVDFLD